MIICGIYDKKALAYKQTFVSENKDTAYRSAGSFARSGTDKAIIDYPADFSLVVLADYDERTGNIHGYDVKDLICEFNEFFVKE